MNGTSTSARIMQRPIRPCMEGTNQTVFGGNMAATVYHLGALEQIEDAYGKIRDLSLIHISGIRIQDTCNGIFSFPGEINLT